MSDHYRCERCGGVIPAEGRPGECPGCLLQAGLGGGEEAGGGPDRAELEELFPGLEIGEFVGRGGMGLVYKAVQRNLGRPVALKLLAGEVAEQASFAERFNREARALARLNHPNIVTVHESGKAGDWWYFIMEYVDGVNLRQALQTGGLTSQEALAIVPQICDALQYAHDQGVVHRDVKPENILLDQQGRVKMADFGLAKLLGGKAVDHTLTREQQVMGTYHYIAPEQLRSAKDVDHRADIYSLGVVFYEMLTGELPMGNFPPPSRKVKVDVHLDQVVLRAMEQEREQRYQRVEEFKTGIQCPHAATAGNRPGERATPPTLGDDAPRQLSKLAVTGLLGAPVGGLAVLIARFAGVYDTLHLSLLFAGVALVGIIFSALAWSAVNADRQRLGGLVLARLGTLYPLLLPGPGLVVMGITALTHGGMFLLAAVPAVVGLILFFIVLKVISNHDSGQGLRRTSGNRRPALAMVTLILLVILVGGGLIMVSALLSPGSAVRDHRGNMHYSSDPNAKVTPLPLEKAQVKELLQRIETATNKKVVKPDDMARLYHPDARSRIKAMSGAQLQELLKKRVLGLGMINLAALPAPLSAYEVRSVDSQGDKGNAFIGFGEHYIGFPLARFEETWFLDLGRITLDEGGGTNVGTAAGRPAAKNPAPLTDEQKEARLDQDLERLLAEMDRLKAKGAGVPQFFRFFHPQARRRLEKATPKEVLEMAINGELGISGGALQDFKGRLSDYTGLKSEYDDGRAKVDLSWGDVTLRLHLRWGEGQWFLDLIPRQGSGDTLKPGRK